MDYSSGIGAHAGTGYVDSEQRGAPRYTSLIRSAKLVCGQGEFLCVVRDVSSTGISLRAFHNLPTDPTLALELQNGESFEIKQVRANGLEGSYRFDKPVVVERLVHETWNYPKRQLRLNIMIPLTISTLTQKADAVTLNISQQGARIECDTVFAIDQTVRVNGPGFPETQAKIRWRRDSNYGLVFENTFSLREFALMAASVQCPSMLEPQ
ncbi:PilZ domain-containing protein [Qipengyuania sp. GH38]|uniref:PilZ domain-containing protein n=1 Tax=Qipengyuania intermedia TaxID=2867244 RepID=UPI001C86D94B|nr:PilZ domain-containing protein [Qipengyuania intermedia]MBX7514046.1 PilZ domain-containing protein [Qipengyuania intermedia]